MSIIVKKNVKFVESVNLHGTLIHFVNVNYIHIMIDNVTTAHHYSDKWTAFPFC